VNLEREFPLESPAVAVPWGITEAAFARVIAGSKPSRVTAGHVRLRARLLGGLDHPVDFYFEPLVEGILRRIELYRSPERNKRRGFQDWQATLESILGSGKPGEETIASQLDGVTPVMWHLTSCR
jgi:hypothetical protein